MWLDALAAIPWHQWVVMTFGTAGIVMTQIEATRRYACLLGLAGQIGWAAGLDLVPAQIGMVVVSVICCGAWMWGFWKYWLDGWLDTAMTVTAEPLTPPRHLTGAGRKPKLTRVK